ncbi:hypothetical protein HC766_02680 [Candidatus Gracilibacteria bacterium]|nr:hypothetical protein [Candidatus Gracilibacteria bacterium]
MINKIRLHKVIKNLVQKKDALEYTKPEIARNIETFGVLIDGKLSKNRLEWVIDGQSIEFIHWPQRKHGDFAKIKVLFQDETLMLLFKPIGVVVQTGNGHQSKNLVQWLRDNYDHQKSFDLSLYPSGGLINRIDKNTQGLILVAKSVEYKNFYQNQFRKRKIIKKYLALVNNLTESQYHVKAWQSRSKKEPTTQKLFWDKKEAQKYDPKARYSESIINPLFVCPKSNQSIIEVSIKTGRMHQIRLHCQELGFPLVNDPKYNKIIPKNLNICESKKAHPKLIEPEVFPESLILYLINLIMVYFRTISKLSCFLENS